MIPLHNFTPLPADLIEAQVDEMHAVCAFDTIQAYWRDPAPFEAARIEGQTRINALFADHDTRQRVKQEARWDAEELAQGDYA